MPVIKYKLDVASLETDRDMYIKNNMENDKKGVVNPMTFLDFLDCFYYADIVISELNDWKSISVHGGLLSFFYQLYSLLSELESNKRTSGFVFGCEQGQFNLELQKKGKKLIITSRNTTYSTDFSTMFAEVKRVYKTIIKVELNKLDFIREDYCFTKFIDNFKQDNN